MHKPDRRYEPKCCYFGPSGRYYTAIWQGGHVIDYELSFPSTLPIANAKSEILRNEFPSDVHVVSFIVEGRPGAYGSCAQMVVSSRRIRDALHDKGTYLVEFSSGNAGATYKPDSVNSAIVMEWFGSTGC